jgi:hypothetical protein
MRVTTGNRMLVVFVNFPCQIQREEETGLYIARCIPLNMGTQGVTEKDAWIALDGLVNGFVQHCATSGDFHIGPKIVSIQPPSPQAARQA